MRMIVIIRVVIVSRTWRCHFTNLIMITAVHSNVHHIFCTYLNYDTVSITSPPSFSEFFLRPVKNQKFKLTVYYLLKISHKILFHCFYLIPNSVLFTPKFNNITFSSLNTSILWTSTISNSHVKRLNVCLFRSTQQYCDYLFRDLTTLAGDGFLCATKPHFLSLHSFLTPFSRTLWNECMYCRPIHMGNTSLWRSAQYLLLIFCVPGESGLDGRCWILLVLTFEVASYFIVEY